MQNLSNTPSNQPDSVEFTNGRIRKFDPAYTDKTILITGAGGTIGLELCKQVLQFTPRQIVLIDHSEIALYYADQKIRELASKTNIECALGSVQEKKFIERIVRENNIDTIVHAAAYKHVPMVEANIVSGLANNVLGTQILAEIALSYNVKGFVLVSTDKAVRPTSVMGASKRLAELVIQDFASRSNTTIFSIVRFGNVIGSSGSVVPLFNEQISKGGPVTLTHKDIKRYFMTVEEAVRLVLTANSLAKGGEVFVLDMGKPVLIYDLAKQMIESRGLTVRDSENPSGEIEIKVTGLRPGEKLNEELFVTSEHQKIFHNQIFQAKESRLTKQEIETAIHQLMQAKEHDSETLAKAVIYRWVDGYSPNGQAEKKLVCAN